MENGHRNEVAKNRAKTGAQGIVNQKPSFMSDGRAAGWWDKLGVHNIIIKHPIQPKKKKVPLFYRGESRISRKAKTEYVLQNNHV